VTLAGAWRRESATGDRAWWVKSDSRWGVMNDRVGLPGLASRGDRDASGGAVEGEEKSGLNLCAGWDVEHG